jgi:hypothetical protein
MRIFAARIAIALFIGVFGGGATAADDGGTRDTPQPPATENISTPLYSQEASQCGRNQIIQNYLLGQNFENDCLTEYETGCDATHKCCSGLSCLRSSTGSQCLNLY